MVPLSDGAFEWCHMGHLKWPLTRFHGHDIFWSRKDKVTIAQEEKYLTYGMVLCLVTLTDLHMRLAGFSASAELFCCIVKREQRKHQQSYINWAERRMVMRNSLRMCEKKPKSLFQSHDIIIVNRHQRHHQRMVFRDCSVPTWHDT